MSQMTSLSDTNGSVFSYAFDGEGNRIRQSLNDCLSTRFVYDGPYGMMELSAGGGSAYGGNVSNQVVRVYVNGPVVDQPIERIGFINGTPRQRQVFHADGLGSIAAMTDESEEPVQTYAYEAFGGIRARTGTGLNRVTFTAREAMGDSLGFYYYRNRVLDPSAGRFTSEDSMGFIDGPNRYIYVMNRPMNFIDPYGLQSDSGCGKPFFDCFASCVEKERFNLGAVAGSAAGALGFGTMPKTPSELRGFGVPKDKLNPYTCQPSRLAGRMGWRGLRDFGRSNLGKGLGALSTGLVVFEGFYDIGAIGRCAAVCANNPCAY